MSSVLHSTRAPRFDYPRRMFSLIPSPAAGSRSTRRAQGGGAPPPGPGGYGPPGGQPPPGGYGGYSPPGGYGPPGPGGYGPPAKPITGSAATMAMHAMTIDPKTGLPRGEKPPASTAAVLALICGILLCLGPFTGIAAIISGLVAKNAIRNSPQSVGGARMATAGIVLGALNLVLSVLLALFWIVQFLTD